MSKKPTLQTVAQKAGVSVPTVSQVLRGTGRISAKTQKKVLDAAKALHYVTDGRAASMRSGQSSEIGMIIHYIANPFNAELISGVSDTLEKEGYLVSVLDFRITLIVNSAILRHSFEVREVRCCGYRRPIRLMKRWIC